MGTKLDTLAPEKKVTEEAKGKTVDVPYDETPGAHVDHDLKRSHMIRQVKEVMTPAITDMVNDAKSTIRAFMEKEGFGTVGSQPSVGTGAMIDDLFKGIGQTAQQTQHQSAEKIGGIIRCVAASKGDPMRALEYAKNKYGTDHQVTKALSTTIGEEGAFVVRDETAVEIIELLRAFSAFRASNPTIIQMSAGTFTLPKLTSGSTANYIGENTNIPVSQPKFGQARLTFKKLAVLIPVSNDFIRQQSPGADAMVRDDMAIAIALRSDLAFIRDDGTQDTPKGMKSQVLAANLLTAQSSTTLTKTTTDLAAMVLKLMEANTRMIRPGWLMAPRTWIYLSTVRDSNGNFAFRPELLLGRLWTYPVQLTTQIPINLGGGADSEIYLADFADIVVGESTTLLLDASQDAAYSDGSNVQAAFGLDQTVLRAIVEHDLAVRHDSSIVITDEVDWTP